jgi:hypothetical protein
MNETKRLEAAQMIFIRSLYGVTKRDGLINILIRIRGMQYFTINRTLPEEMEEHTLRCHLQDIQGKHFL